MNNILIRAIQAAFTKKSVGVFKARKPRILLSKNGRII